MILADMDGFAEAFLLLLPGTKLDAAWYVAEHAPGGDHVGGRITDPGAAEVDDGTQAAVADQQVGPEQVAVDPHRRSRPRRCLEGALPGGDGHIAVDDTARRPDRRPRVGVEVAQRLAPAARRADGIDAGTSGWACRRSSDKPRVASPMISTQRITAVWTSSSLAKAARPRVACSSMRSTASRMSNRRSRSLLKPRPPRRAPVGGSGP